MTRRSFFRSLLTLGLSTIGSTLLSGCDLMGKRNIKNFGKSFEYLQNPELRTQETSDALLVIRDAEISGTSFYDLQWRNIHFINCDFSGAYEIRLDTMENCLFEDCRILGIHDFGDMNQVRFLRCQSFGPSNWGGDINSRNVVFEACEFDGQNPDPNHWLAVGTYGQSEFIRCKVRWTHLVGDRGTTLRECECENTAAAPVPEGRKENEPFAALLIENCKFKGLFEVRPANLQSFTLRDTRFENIDLTGADIRGDVTIERVNGGYIKAVLNVGTANNLVVRDSKFSSTEIHSTFTAGAFKSVLVENCSFSIGSFTKPAVIIGGGFDIDNPEPQPILTQSMILRNIQTRFIRSAGLNAGLFRIEGCEFDYAELHESKIDRLEIETTTIHHRLDLSRTQAREQSIKISKPSGVSPRLDVLDGSNIRIPY